METNWTFEELDLKGALRMVIEDVKGMILVRDFGEKFRRYQQVRQNLIDLLY